MWYGKQDS